MRNDRVILELSAPLYFRAVDSHGQAGGEWQHGRWGHREEYRPKPDPKHGRGGPPLV